MFDTKEAVVALRNALMTVKEEIGITKTDIYITVESRVVESLQRDREENFDLLKAFKCELQKNFPQFDFAGRIKSLTSILAKYMQDRTLADAFGFSVKTKNVSECYEFANWLGETFRIRDLEDRIKSPKSNGYSDLKIVIEYKDILVEFIIQDEIMYQNAHTIQKHCLAYPWKYSEAIINLPSDYKQVNF